MQKISSWLYAGLLVCFMSGHGQAARGIDVSKDCTDDSFLQDHWVVHSKKPSDFNEIEKLIERSEGFIVEGTDPERTYDGELLDSSAMIIAYHSKEVVNKTHVQKVLSQIEAIQSAEVGCVSL